MKKNLIIICCKQFGYLSDYYYYCQFLKDYSITYICKDQKLERIQPTSNTTVHYVNNKIFFLGIIKFLPQNIKKNNTIFFIYYQKLAFLFSLLLPKARKILDIRTGDVSNQIIKQKIFNFLIFFDSLFFNDITIITESLRGYLKLPLKKCSVVPLGAEVIGYQPKKIDDLQLIYVGTFYNRDIHKTVLGVKLFLNENPDIKLKYTIIGFGPQLEVEKIKGEIKKCELNDLIELKGRINHDELKPFFEKANVGVSFVPIRNQYSCQPPTKTYEYICSGIICLATATPENSLIINEQNGILIQDTPTSFANGLKQIWGKRNLYCPEKIMEDSKKYSWENVINQYLIPIVENLHV